MIPYYRPAGKLDNKQHVHHVVHFIILCQFFPLLLFSTFFLWSPSHPIPSHPIPSIVALSLVFLLSVSAYSLTKLCNTLRPTLLDAVAYAIAKLTNCPACLLVCLIFKSFLGPSLLVQELEALSSQIFPSDLAHQVTSIGAQATSALRVTCIPSLIRGTYLPFNWQHHADFRRNLSQRDHSHAGNRWSLGIPAVSGED